MVNDILAGQYESVFKGQGMEFREVREYVPGDDIRMIDWNVTARTGVPHVKLLAEERELTVMLMVDASGSERFGGVGRLKIELAAELCAVLAFSAIQNNDKVGLIVFTDDVELYVPPSKGRKHVLRVIREVLHFQPRGRRTNIPGALHFLRRHPAPGRHCFVLISAEATRCRCGWRTAVMTDRGTRERSARGVSARCRAGRRGGCGVWARDPRRHECPQRARGICPAARQRTKTRDEIFRRTGVDVISVRTDRSYVNELYRFFRMRERRYG